MSYIMQTTSTTAAFIWAPVYLINIWNIIEAFRENGLNNMELRTEINVSHLETLLSSIFYQLNKRLPSAQQLDINLCTAKVLNWLLALYDKEDRSKISAFSLKVALATMCAGKLMDKLRYIFSLISEPNGLLIHTRFADFLKEALVLPCAVYESPTFSFKESLASRIFDHRSKITVNDFLDTIISDPGPSCLVWLPLLHRLANVENVFHPVQCDGCNRESFRGFRYKCQQCYNYQLCQDCFWRGRISGNHSNQHEMKEYTTYKSPSKQLGHSLRKSFQCVPEKPANVFPRFPEKPERPLNLSHIVPASPATFQNGFSEVPCRSVEKYPVESHSSHAVAKSPQYASSVEAYQEEEHNLIARYAAHLADSSSLRSPSEISLSQDTNKQQELILQLENENRDIMRKIMCLRQQQMGALVPTNKSSTLISELHILRQRKNELETHLCDLQESRRELMIQLEALMKLLKNHQGLPTTPSSSHSGTNRSLLFTTPYPLSSSRSAPTTPGSGIPTFESFSGVGAKHLPFTSSASTRSLQNDLLIAADSVTNAMSSLVRELNSGSEDEERLQDHKLLSSSRDFETEDTESPGDSLEIGSTLWQEKCHRSDENRFLEEICARNVTNTSPGAIGGIDDTETQELYDGEIGISLFRRQKNH
ncbi:dystrobrevin beta-like isoform X2 [Centruroides sculpturatus]|uniref:dystrobrevin beta-like isoform X2 n=1 Tax=Centruroides sculpturatus TaxID=218467 RepID=UPI000C6EEF3B|nr:dystrobrevin beta-like isoform X2 [Centruroides sculpturatus]